MTNAKTDTIEQQTPSNGGNSALIPPPAALRKRAGSGCATLVAVFFVAVLAFGAAYQARPAYFIDLGDRLDRPFVSNFNDREPSEKDRLNPATKWDGVHWRWSKGQSYIDLPGLGSQPLTVTLRFTPSVNPDPSLTIFVNHNPVPLALPIEKGWNVWSFQVQPNWFPDGHLHLRLKSNNFQPRGDPRELGLAIDWVKVEPASFTSSSFIRPPDSDFLPLVFTAALAVLIFLSIGIPPVLSLAAGGVVVAGFSYWIMNDRLSLTVLIERDFVRTMFFLWVVAYATTEFAPPILRWLGVSATRREGGWLAALFLLQFSLLYFFQLHPQFLTSDLGISIHDVQRVSHGELVFTRPLPDERPAPYPPAFYVLLLPFTALSGLEDKALGNLVELVNSVLAASGVFLVYYLASLLRQTGRNIRASHSARPSLNSPTEREFETGTNWAALIAAAFYAICRFPFLIFSQGNHPNLFGAWAFLLFLAIVTGTLCYLRDERNRWPRQILPARPEDTPHRSTTSRRPRSTDELPGLDFLHNLEQDRAERRKLKSVTPLVVKRGVGRALAVWRRSVWPVIVRISRYLLPVAALLLVFLSHYGTFLFSNAFMLVYVGLMAVLAGREGRREAVYLFIGWVSAFVLALLFYYYNFLGLIGDQFGNRLGSSPARPAFDLFKALSKLYSDNRDWFGLIVLIAMLGGLVSWLVNRYLARPKGWWQLEPISVALLALAATSLVFALTETVQGIESRYQLYLSPVIVILAAGFLGRLWRSGWAGVVLVVALFLFQLLTTVLFWLDRVNYYFL